MKIRENFRLVVLLFTLCVTTGDGSSIAEISQPLFAPNVHSGIVWETGPSDMTGLELVKTGMTSLGLIKVYRNKLENLNYHDIKFNSIEYGFTDREKLIFVAYKSEGMENWAAFKKLAIGNYGPGFVRHESNRYIIYIWNINGYTVALEYDKISKSSVLLLVSG